MKVDPYKHQEKWQNWKETNTSIIHGLSKVNSDLILRYLVDMELGINTAVSSKKGSRSYARMNTLKNRLVFLSKRFKDYFGLEDMTKLTEQQVCSFFARMRTGEIKRDEGRTYKSVRDYVKIFKAFWHWYQKISKREGREVEDITIYLDSSGTKPKWVYLTEEQVKKLYESAKPNYKLLIMFLFDTGMRAPTELVNIKVSDFYNDFKEVEIREETSKTFGRRFKLMLCSDLVKNHVRENKLSADDYLFKIQSPTVNKYLKRLSKKLFGEGKSPGGEPLLFSDNRYIIEKVSEKLGKDRISITATGKGLEKVDPRWLSRVSSEIGFTYDLPFEGGAVRPRGYNSSNLEAIRNLKRSIPTMAQIPLTKENNSPEIIGQIYQNLRDADVDSVLLMDFFECGRGHGKGNLILNQYEKASAVREYKRQESLTGGPIVKVIPSLKGPITKNLVRSFDIDFGGNLLSDPWSYDSSGKPYDSVVMGNLRESKLSEITGKNIYQAYFTQLKHSVKK